MNFVKLLTALLVITGLVGIMFIPDSSTATAGEDKKAGDEKKKDDKEKAGENKGGDDDGPAQLGERGEMESKHAEKINKAVEAGCQWVLKAQNADGSWTSASGTEGTYKVGTTALALFAVLKGGIDRANPAIPKGFDFIRQNLKLFTKPQDNGQITYTYDVAMTVLALEAFYAQPTKKQKKEDEDKGLSTVPAEERAKDNFVKFAGADNEWMKKLIEWLVATQEPNSVWRYPGPAQDGNRMDASNSQYVMLALNTARRLGFNIPAQVWLNVANYFLTEQEKDGPDVEYFQVPAADLSILKLKKQMGALRKELLKIAKKEKKPVDQEDMMKTGVDPYEEFGKEDIKMKARGWSYVPHDKCGIYIEFGIFCGSMTTSGVAALVIAKAALEEMGQYKQIQKQVDQSIRDGCAWLAHNFTVQNNPKRQGYHYYYLYGLERAGALSLAREFGKHDWYDEGAEYLLAQQTGDGSWPESGHMSVFVDTCFAILFLCKATTPIVVMPFAETGGYMDNKPEKKPEKKEETPAPPKK